jgi:hydrocephalus-inducing protein
MRVAECRLTNASQIRFDYSWRIAKFVSLRTNYAQVRVPPFAVEPVSGYIESGATTTFKVNFTPLEVDDFTAELRCDIPFLSQSDPPVVGLSGLSRRPLCHFNVELSDYLSAGRRHPDYTSPLNLDMKVIELFAKGVGYKTLKRFELINPTASPYEVNWRYIGEGPTPIFCETPDGLISSGKRSMVIFGYLPVSVKTVESLWEFQMPEQSVRVQFLFVGRIMVQ